ncbi:MAG TPA: adenosylmethionine--8-amino-7-oxononanoate transaminase [Verrucomicrobiae bacterium]|nr:adenosylmethionine--8-amino-7-oxononanoate transaminase [Verrucomicrobiae bacterium]
MKSLAELDQQFVWHPFTQMREWQRHEPIVIIRGEGAIIEDATGRKYLDANSSIWTNLHGHNHAVINSAIQDQLGKIAHSSALGLANEPASLLAGELIEAANRTFHSALPQTPAQPALTKVFYSDDGSTAMEVALKLASEFARRRRSVERPRFLSLESAYHGDTIGAVSLGHIDLFQKSYAGLLFQTDKVMAPYCYRCPFNRAKPEHADAREYRKCQWECVGKVEQRFESQKQTTDSAYAAMVVEPLMQGAAGMIAHPSGWLARVNEIVHQNNSLLIADEVMTGFGRVCVPEENEPALFASHVEGVQPDLMALAKGLSGGYLPMAVTLTSQAIFDAFLGDYSEFKTFFHGHSFTGNQLGSAAALASLQLLQTAESMAARRKLESALRKSLVKLWDYPNVGDIRQEGTVVGVEFVKDWKTRQPFDLSERAGIRVCEEMANHGVLTRPIGNVVVLMPPYCTTSEQAEEIVWALKQSVQKVFGPVT